MKSSSLRSVAAQASSAAAAAAPFRLQGCMRQGLSGPAVIRRSRSVFAGRQSVTACGYATHHQKSEPSSSSSSSRRRSVTPFNDDGHVPWAELSVPEKTARAAQQTFNFGMVIVGVALTGGVAYFLYTEVFSPTSKVAYFNRAVDRIRSDYRCVDLLGEGKEISAFGEETYNKWRRARPLASTTTTDTEGMEHIVMHFNVKGPKAQGVANLHMVRYPGQDEFVYRYFFIDVPGKDRLYLEHDSADHAGGRGKKTKLFGINWT